MGWFKSDPPQPPNPTQTAAAQTGTNVSTGVANAFLNNVNQVTPQGNLTYTAGNNYSWTDPSSGQTYSIPRFTATQTLSPAQQNLSNLGIQSQTNLANLASQQSNSLRGLFAAPFNPITGSPGSPGTPGTPGYWDAFSYLQANPDVAAAANASGGDLAAFALQHFNQFGQGEGRSGLFNAMPGTGPTAATGPAPMAGEAGWLGSPGPQFGYADVGGQQRSIGGYGQQQTSFGDAGDITRSYGPGDFSADRSRVEQSLYERMEPQLQRDRSQLEARLADQGIKIGSAAYQDAMDQFDRKLTDTRLGITQAGGQEQQRMMDMAAQRAGFQNAAQMQDYQQKLGRGSFANEAQQRAYEQTLGAGQFANQAQTQDYSQAAMRSQFYNQAAAQEQQRLQNIFNAYNTSRQQYLAEQYQQRSQPINEITSLMSGSQVRAPSFVTTPTNQIANTDYAGIVNSAFSQNFANWNAINQNTSQILGGLFGAVGGLARSDRREKNVGDRMGTVFAANPKGETKKLPVYEFAYKDDPSSTRHIGPMAQDVERIDKSAVKTVGRTKYIDKTKLGSILKVA